MSNFWCVFFPPRKMFPLPHPPSLHEMKLRQKSFAEMPTVFIVAAPADSSHSHSLSLSFHPSLSLHLSLPLFISLSCHSDFRVFYFLCVFSLFSSPSFELFIRFWRNGKCEEHSYKKNIGACSNRKYIILIRQQGLISCFEFLSVFHGLQLVCLNCCRLLPRLWASVPCRYSGQISQVQ